MFPFFPHERLSAATPFPNVDIHVNRAAGAAGFASHGHGAPEGTAHDSTPPGAFPPRAVVRFIDVRICAFPTSAGRIDPASSQTSFNRRDRYIAPNRATPGG